MKAPIECEIGIENHESKKKKFSIDFSTFYENLKGYARYKEKSGAEN